MIEKSIIDDIQDEFGIESSTLTDAFLSGVLGIVEKMRYYEEEGRRIQFRLVVGFSSKPDDLRLYKLQSKSIGSLTNDNDVSKTTYKAIKNVLSCSRENTDVYVIFDDDRVEAGLVFLDPEDVSYTFYSLLTNGFIVFDCLSENTILIKSSHTKIIKHLDFECDEGITTFDSMHCQDKNLRERYWAGVFEQVKRACHGTICLFVESEFDVGSLSERFVDSSMQLVEDITIAPSRSGGTDALESRHALQLFLSILNYDGITIVDVSGRIRSYNIICKLDGSDVDESFSGSRHMAYDNIVKWDNSGLVAVYFQSQEGEIRFHDYIKDEDKEYFDSDVIERELNKEGARSFQLKYNETKAHINQIITDMNHHKRADYTGFFAVIQNLMAVHNGVDNFYREIEAVDRVEKCFEEGSEWNELIKDEFSKGDDYAFIRMRTLSVIFACIIGNSYGYSFAAQDSLLSILKMIPDVWVVEYFKDELYIDPYLLQDLRFTGPCVRWKSRIKELIEDRLSGLDDSGEIIKDAFEHNPGYFLRMMLFMDQY